MFIRTVTQHELEQYEQLKCNINISISVEMRYQCIHYTYTIHTLHMFQYVPIVITNVICIVFRIHNILFNVIRINIILINTYFTHMYMIAKGNTLLLIVLLL